jgi:hypothetical protein
MNELCLVCKQEIESHEIYGDWYYCLNCCKDLYFQPERLSEKDQLTGNSRQLICDSPNTPTKGSEPSRND